MMEDLRSSLATLQHGGAMIYPLMALAVLTVVIILEKAFVFARRAKLPGELTALIESFGFAEDDLARQMARLDERNYFARFLRVIDDNRQRPTWWLESRAADEASLIEKACARWLWVLETIVTAAPLLGLLGTIAGMVRSFRLFGEQSLVDPTGVTGGVAEALIATAVGLIVALVALFAFNYFSARQAATMDEMERLGTRLIDHIRLGMAQGGEGRP